MSAFNPTQAFLMRYYGEGTCSAGCVDLSASDFSSFMPRAFSHSRHQLRHRRSHVTKVASRGRSMLSSKRWMRNLHQIAPGPVSLKSAPPLTDAIPQIRSQMCAQSLNMSGQLLLARTRISRVLVTLRHWLGCQRIEFDLCGESRILLKEQRRRTAQAPELAGHIS